MRPLQRTCTAEDAVQEVFRRALQSGLLRDFEDRGRGSLEAALSKVLDNTLVDMARREASLKRGGGHARVDLAAPDSSRGLERVAADDTTPTSHACSRDFIEWARGALTEREFEIWFALEMEGRDSGEVARALDVTGSSVRGVLFRAQRKLMTSLERFRPRLRSDGGT